jgi:hypothetical protein
VLHEHFLASPLPGGSPAALAGPPAVPAESRAFVTTYLQHAGPVVIAGFAARALLYTGTRLVQTALEMLSANAGTDASGVRGVLQTAESVFRHGLPLAMDLFPEPA